MKLCPNRSAAEGRPLKRGLLPSHGRIRRGPEGSSRKVDVRRSWDPRVETTTGTPCLEEMPITNGRHHRLCCITCLSHETGGYQRKNNGRPTDPKTWEDLVRGAESFLSLQITP